LFSSRTLLIYCREGGEIEQWTGEVGAVGEQAREGSKRLEDAVGMQRLVMKFELNIDEFGLFFLNQLG
jgi:hypothetical protein